MRRWGTFNEAIGFWLVTLALSLLAGVLSYQAGRQWVGQQLAKTFINEGREIRPISGEEAGRDTVGTEPPPARAKVEIEPRAPGEAEQRELEIAAAEEAARGQAERPKPEEAAPPEEPAERPEPERPAAREPAPAGRGYTVTAGSYSVAANAERVKADLEAQGYQPHISQLEQRGVKYHRVIVGVYGDRARADEVRRKLEEAGFVAGVVAPGQ